MSMPLTYSLKKGLNNNRGETTGPSESEAQPTAAETATTVPHNRHSSEDSFSNDDAGSEPVAATGVASAMISSLFERWWPDADANAIPPPREAIEDDDDGISVPPPPPPPPARKSSPSHSPKSRRRRMRAIKRLKRHKTHMALLAASPQQPPKESREEAEEAAIKGRQRRVRFAPPSSTAVQHVPSRSSYTSAELKSMWLTRIDLLKVKFDAGRVVAQMRRDDQTIDEYNSNTITSRGLERHASDESNEERRVRKANVVWAVLTEQAKGKNHGGNAEGRIRYASVKAGAKSGEMAQAAGEWDEYVVRRFAAEEEEKEKEKEDKVDPVVAPVGTAAMVTEEDDEECSCGIAEEREPAAHAAIETSVSSSPCCVTAFPETDADAKPLDLALGGIEVPLLSEELFLAPPSPEGRHKRTKAMVAYFDTPLDILPSDLGCEISIDKIDVVDEMSAENEISVDENSLPLVENSIQCKLVNQQQSGYIQQRLRTCDSYHWRLAEVQVRRNILCW